MSASRGGLNEEEVNAEMGKMVAFIKQEALEKAREIKVKADEEFNIEKAKLVRQETMQIDAYYQKKKKQAEVQKKITVANHLNKNRLRLLQKRHELFDDLLTQCRNSLASQIKSDAAGYKNLLSKLVLQGLLELMDKEVNVVGLKEDQGTLKSVVGDAAAEYEKMAKMRVTITVSDSEFLNPTEDLGGVVLYSAGGKIACRNTLEARLGTASDKLLPRVRMMLYGKSENRRFFD
eukprot:TRINITY_DN80200_c0_g1_i1.p1 TRINITY_DN80200_c0_g1~~TRINITY_DN80200_c0_g1_i1.p1  ORF type:complete len:234 (-),score=42.63 TRINITY_DN80200_c0_g1_i1:250-951(-)